MPTHVLKPSYFFQILPDITSVISKWQSLSKKEKINNEEKNTPLEGSVTQADVKNEIPGTRTEHSYFVVYLSQTATTRVTVAVSFPFFEQLLRQLRLSS